MDDFIRGHRLTDTEFSRMMINDLGLTDEELESVIGAFNNVPLTNPIPAEEIVTFLREEN